MQAIWNWMDNFPEEFTEIQQQQNEELADCCEKLCELFHTFASESHKRKGYVWPLQIMLLILCPKILEEIKNAQHGAPCSQQHIRKVRSLPSLVRLLDNSVFTTCFCPV